MRQWAKILDSLTLQVFPNRNFEVLVELESCHWMSSSTVWLKSRLGTVKAEAVRKPFLKSIGLELEVLLAWFEQVVKLPGLIPPQELILLCVIIFYL